MCYFFFFKQKTAYEMRISDWSSDVCSSDLLDPVPKRDQAVVGDDDVDHADDHDGQQDPDDDVHAGCSSVQMAPTLPARGAAAGQQGFIYLDVADRKSVV